MPVPVRLPPPPLSRYAPREWLTLSAVLGVFLWVHAAAAGELPPLLLRRLIQPGVTGEVTTLKGEALTLEQMRLKTPEDFDTISADEPILTFTAAPEPPNFHTIRKITLNGLTTQWLYSRPDQMEFYRLGSLRNAVPPPPDWQRSYGQSDAWKPTRATVHPEGLPFLNHAIFCWTGQPRDDEKEVGIYLFRQGVTIEHPTQIARAVLRLACNVEPLEASLNEWPLHLGGQKPFSLAEYEVTPLIKPGLNILAIRVRERPGVPEANFGLAFHFELLRRSGAAQAPELNPTAALITSTGGDRLWGWPHDFRGDRILMETHYGLYSLEWSDCAGVIFPGGWRPAPPRPNLAQRIMAAPPPIPSDLTMNGLPLAMSPYPLQDCMLLTEGRMSAARPNRVVGDTLYFEGAEGKQYTLPMKEVLGIFPPRPATTPLKLESRQTAALYCQVETNAGDVALGTLRELNSEKLTLESAGGQFLTIRPEWIASITFPYHAISLGPGVKNTTIGIMGLISGQEPYQDLYNADARAVQIATVGLGAQSKTLTNDILADEEQLRPSRFPVLVSVDPTGEYLHTLNTPGDAQAALLRYLEAGGTVVAVSRGGALVSPVKNDGGIFVRSPADPDVAKILGLKTLKPGESTAAGARPFEHPPNTAEPIYFQLTGAVPPSLVGLPGRIDLAPMLNAPFYPVLSRGSRVTVIYDLASAAGSYYGPGLSLIARGRGTLIIIDHLLWESRVDGRPFGERVLPTLLGWALAGKAF